jgi:peptide/nickel transport system permease protein
LRQYVVRRILMLIPVLLTVSVLASSLIYMAPGDPVRVMLGLRANEEAVAKIRSELELDKPIYVRYLKWLGNVLRGDLGRSLQRNEHVANMIAANLLHTVELAAFAFVISILLAIPAGVISAVKVNTWVDNFLSFWALFWVSMPGFWVAILALMVFSLGLGWFPISGRGGSILTLKGLSYIILPGIILGLRQVAVIMRLIRASMLEVLSADYTRTARAKGLAERIVIYRHAFRNALIPTVTIFGIQIPEFLSMSVIIETVFAWPGLGRMLVDAVLKMDYTLVQGIVLVYALLVVFLNFLVDILYGYIDPRIKQG